MRKLILNIVPGKSFFWSVNTVVEKRGGKRTLRYFGAKLLFGDKWVKTESSFDLECDRRWSVEGTHEFACLAQWV